MTTLSQEICARLAEDIVNGRVAPGQKLEEQTVADQFKVSRSPVRDALRQLAATGLVDILPRRGVTVAKIDVDQLRDMYEASSELEALCARLCAQRITPAERMKLESVHEQGRIAARRNENKLYARLNEEFHELIYRGTRNKSIEALAKSFRQRLAPFRSQIFFQIAERMKSSATEHDEITDAILAGDGDRAFRAMRAHIASSAMNVIDYFERSVAAGSRPRRNESGQRKQARAARG
jgi:DNA-binding GntR family transcriptional regulator